MGHECLVAVDGNIGIELAKEGCPDLILMDIQMPSMDGLAALSLLKKNPVTQSIPVVAVTSFAMESDRTRLLEAGFTDYLAKPVDTHQFKTIVQDILERRDDH